MTVMRSKVVVNTLTHYNWGKETITEEQSCDNQTHNTTGVLAPHWNCVVYDTESIYKQTETKCLILNHSPPLGSDLCVWVGYHPLLWRPKNVCFADVFISRCSQSGNEQGGTKEGYLVGTELSWVLQSTQSYNWQQCRPKCLLLNGTSLSVAAQTTLYYLTIPTEGYLTWWTPFATRPTPNFNYSKSFNFEIV